MKWEKFVIEDEFPGVEIPKLDWIKIKLQHNKTVNNTNKTEVSDFNINIDISEKLSNEDKEMSKKIQEICKLNFPPYYWREKSYKFYTTERTGSLEEKQQILNNLFVFLKDYEAKKENQFSNSNVVFEKDAKEKKSYDLPDLCMKFHEPTKRFVVLAKDFLGSEKYSLLRGSSEYSSQLIEFLPKENQNKYLLSSDFFADLVTDRKLEKKTYFFIKPELYEKVKNHFEEELKKQNDFLNKQKEISKTMNLEELNVTEENVFDFKIQFIPEKQAFSFYSKGYFDNAVYNGIRTHRNLLGLWGLNFIYTEENQEQVYSEEEVLIENKKKIVLEEVKGGSRREKDVRIPASEWEKVKKLKENYEKEIDFWKRPVKSIKITHCDFTKYNIFDRFPAIYIDNKGSTFFIFGSRRVGYFKSVAQNTVENNGFNWFDDNDTPIIPINKDGTEKKQPKFSQTLKAIPISFKEAKFFLEEHPFADKIKSGSLLLNHVIHDQLSGGITMDEQIKTFDKVWLMAEISSQTSEVQKNKPRRMKI